MNRRTLVSRLSAAVLSCALLRDSFRAPELWWEIAEPERTQFYGTTAEINEMWRKVQQQMRYQSQKQIREFELAFFEQMN